MKISNDFKYVKDEQALLVVTGTKTAHIHVLKNGEINERDSMIIETPHYSDDEGFNSEMTPSGNMTGVKVSYNNQKDYLATKFLKALCEHVKNTMSKYAVDKIYLFGPEFFIGQEEHIFPNELRERIVAEFNGNFTNQTTKDLVEKINDMYTEENDVANPATGEAARILHNTGII